MLIFYSNYRKLIHLLSFGMDLTEAEDIKKRWQEYTEELYKKGLNDPGKNDGVVTHLELNIWSVKSSGP